MGRRGYPAEFRRKVLDLVESGRPVADVAKALGISDQTIHTWRRQDRIDRPFTTADFTFGVRSAVLTPPVRVTGRTWGHVGLSASR